MCKPAVTRTAFESIPQRHAVFLCSILPLVDYKTSIADEFTTQCTQLATVHTGYTSDVIKPSIKYLHIIQLLSY